MVKTPAVTILPPNKQETSLLAPKVQLQSQRFFRKLSPKDQEALVERDRELTAARVVHGMSGLAIGQFLHEVNELLTPYNAYYKYLRSKNIPPKTSYRYIRGYENAVNHFPEPVLRVAVARNLRIVSDDERKPLGEYTEAFRSLGAPPKDPERAVKYVDDMQTYVKERRARLKRTGKSPKSVAELAVIEDPKEALKYAYRSLSIYIKKLPAGTRKMNWLDHLVGMLLTDMGVSSRSFEAAAVPEDFRAKRGRPRLVREEGEAAS